MGDICGLFITCCLLCAVLINRQKVETEIPAFKTELLQAQVNKIRGTALKDTARCIGAQAGLFWSAKNINQLLNDQDKLLNQTFNFQP